jgi:CRISPR-associated protein Cas2
MDSYLVYYDISDPKRLRKVATICEDFGRRTQLSVFLCRLSATEFVKLRSRLYDVIDLQRDQVHFLPLCAKCVNNIEAIGRPIEAPDAKDMVVVV